MVRAIKDIDSSNFSVCFAESDDGLMSIEFKDLKGDYARTFNRKVSSANNFQRFIDMLVSRYNHEFLMEAVDLVGTAIDRHYDFFVESFGGDALDSFFSDLRLEKAKKELVIQDNEELSMEIEDLREEIKRLLPYKQKHRELMVQTNKLFVNWQEDKKLFKENTKVMAKGIEAQHRIIEMLTEENEKLKELRVKIGELKELQKELLTMAGKADIGIVMDKLNEIVGEDKGA